MRISPRRLLAVTSVVLALAVPAAAHAAPDARVTNGTKVGQTAFASRWGSIVSVQQRLPFTKPSDRLLHICGGTLIAPDLVLTARHCAPDLWYANAPYEVLVNHRLLSGTKLTNGDDRAKVIDWWVHPLEWSSVSGLSADVAVLKLDRPLAAPVMRIVADNQDALWGAGGGLATGAYTAGWGNTNTRPDELDDEKEPVLPLSPPALLETPLPIVADRVCESSDTEMFLDSFDFDRSTMLCAGTLDTRKHGASTRTGACNGDSGGPLIVPDGSGGWLQTGVVSWGPSYAGGCNSYSVYARLDGVRPWLDSIIANNGDPSTVTAGAVVSSKRAGPSSLRVRWSGGTGTPRTLVVIRELGWKEMLEAMGMTVGDYERYEDEDADPDEVALEEMIRRLRTNMSVARGGPQTESLLVRGVTPRRPGRKRMVTLRLIVDDAEGRPSYGDRVQVSAPIDANPPTGLGVPRVRGTRGGAVRVWWAPAHDDDCVARYIVEIREADTRQWRRRATNPAGVCKDMYEELSGSKVDTGGYFDDFFAMYFGRPNDHALDRLAAGSYQLRVTAVDRAGNRTRSRPIRVAVPKLVRPGDDDDYFFDF